MTDPGIQGRLSKLRASFAEQAIDGILVNCPENRRYLSGFTGSDGYLLISHASAVIATDFRYFEQSQREAPDFKLLPLKGYAHKWLPEAAAEMDLKRVGFESAHLTFSTYRQFVDAISTTASGIELVPKAGLAESLRAVKDDAESALIAQAARLAHHALGEFSRVLRAGMTEKEAAWLLERILREEGSETLPFEVIVASGPNAALPHARPSEKAIAEREPVVIDFGARRPGYCCDITRTLWLGEADDKLARVYDVVHGAQRTAIELIRGAMTGAEADRLARTVIDQCGYADAFGHGLGHGVGLETHEAPRLGVSSEDVLKDGMVFTIEPGIYLPGWGGVRIEDTVIAESGRVRVLC